MKRNAEISGSIIETTNSIRDENGFYFFESPDKPYNSIEEDYHVRLQVRQNSAQQIGLLNFWK